MERDRDIEVIEIERGRDGREIEILRVNGGDTERR